MKSDSNNLFSNFTSKLSSIFDRKGEDSSSTSWSSSTSGDVFRDCPTVFSWVGNEGDFNLNFDHCNVLVVLSELNIDLDDFARTNPALSLSLVDLKILRNELPKMNPTYCKRVYFDFGYNLVDGSLPTRVEMNLQDNLKRNSFDDAIIIDDDNESSSFCADCVFNPDGNVIIYCDLHANVIDCEDVDCPDCIYADDWSVPCKSHCTVCTDLIKCKEHFEYIPDMEDFCSQDKEMCDFQFSNDCDLQKFSREVKRSLGESLETPLFQAQYIRRGPKQRGRVHGARHNMKRDFKDKNSSKVVRDRLKKLRDEKRRDKIEKGHVWKVKNSSRGAKQSNLLNVGYSDMNDRKIADKIAKIETLETEIENLYKPNTSSEFYSNAYKEREFYLDQLNKEKQDFKKKEYQRNELELNKILLDLMEHWKSTDCLSYSRSSSICDDLDKIESFIKENVKDDVAINLVVNSVSECIESKPDLLDRCSNFLKELILKIRPIAFGVDAVRDVALNIDVLKEEQVVEFLEPVFLSELQSVSSKFIEFDVRDDHARRGDLVHMDPLLRHFQLKRLMRNGVLSQQVDYRGVLSCELLFQLLSPSVCVMNAPESIVMSKMQHIASNCHTINIPKFSIIEYHTDIVQDTLIVARAIFLLRRRVSLALGFPIAPV